jgi:hypothetical protein
MHRNLKRELENSIPANIKLNEERKNAILHEANRRMKTEKPSRKPFTKPAIAAIVVIGLTGFLAFPYVQEELQQQTSQDLHTAIQRVIVKDVNDPNLARAIYVDGTDELIYTEENGIYAFSIGAGTTKTIAAPHDETLISGVNIAANERWVAWKDNGKATFVMNQMSGEIKELDQDPWTIQISGDRLIYMALPEPKKIPQYIQMDLHTFTDTPIHELSGKGSQSTPAIHDNLIAISEGSEKFGGTTFTIYDLDQNRQIAVYTLPYEIAVNVTLTDDKLYASLRNSDSSPILGYINLEDGQFHKIDAPDFNAFAVYEDYLALSIPKKDSDTVELFAIEQDTAKPLPYLNNIKERLVKPRFTETGTLVLNGEGADRAMYLVDVKALRK